MKLSWFCISIGLCVLCVNIDDTGAGQQENDHVCYEQLVPKFHIDPADGSVNYFSFRIVNNSTNCGGEFDEEKAFLFSNRLNIPSSEGLEIDIPSSPMIVSKKMAKGILQEPGSPEFQEPYRYYKGPFRFNAFLQDVWYPRAKLISRTNQLGIWARMDSTVDLDLDPNIFITNSVVPFKSDKFGGTLHKLNLQTGIPEGGPWWLQNHRPMSNPPRLTSNHCWLIVPTANEALVNAGDVTQYIHHNPNLEIYALNQGSSKYYCNEPGLRSMTGSGAFQLLGNGCDSNNGDCIDNALNIGVDFDAHSPGVDRLEIVYQSGFKNDSSEEKSYQGGLKIAELKRVETVLAGYTVTTVEKEEIEFDITKNCLTEAESTSPNQPNFDGWASNPKYSTDKKHIFFLAMDKLGNDRSPNNLYATQVNRVKADDFTCTRDVINLTGRFKLDYPIMDYRVDPAQRTVTLFFEEKGETVVRFYKLGLVSVYDNERDKPEERYSLDYEYPYKLDSIGKIYDLISPGFHRTISGEQIYYVFHSTVDTPIGISRCYRRNKIFVCGGADSKIRQSSDLAEITKIAKKFNDIEDSDFSEVRVSKLPWVKRTNPSKEMSEVPTLKFNPSKPNGIAIVSIHGGPNEAYDGSFHQRENFLARLGYTVFMPNPAGSTGYGYTYTGEAKKNWGTTVFDDIDAVITKVDKLGFEKLYVMGFSFGGYMTNWIQTKESEDVLRSKINGLIGISAFIDIKKFADTTDQLWFPEHHVGCSKDCDSYQSTTDPDSPIQSQNPIKNTASLDRGSIPILFISGELDQRVLFSANVRQMLEEYRKECAPHTFLSEKSGAHAFSNYRTLLSASYIHHWIGSLDSCREKSGKWKLKCKTKQHKLRLLQRYTGEVFDNLTIYSTTDSRKDHKSLVGLMPSDLGGTSCM